MLHSHTHIFTGTGIKKLKEIKEGDLVFNLAGELTPVLGIKEETFLESKALGINHYTNLGMTQSTSLPTWSKDELEAYKKEQGYKHYCQGKKVRLNSKGFPKNWNEWTLKEKNWLSEDVVKQALNLKSRGMVFFNIAQSLNIPPLLLAPHFRDSSYVLAPSLENTGPKLRDIKEVEFGHVIPINSGLNYPEKDLPLDPYIFGVWLVSLNQGLRDNIMVMNYEVPFITSKLRDLAYDFKVQRMTNSTTHLKIKGIDPRLCYKRIPQNYLCSSPSQRLELLQGIMDGVFSEVRERNYAFPSASKNLVRDLCLLLSSLGIKFVYYPAGIKSKLYEVWFSTDKQVFKSRYKLRELPDKHYQESIYNYYWHVNGVNSRTYKTPQKFRSLQIDGKGVLYGVEAIPIL